MKYAWITRRRDSFPIAVMCQLLKVSRSGCYDSFDRPVNPRAKRTQKIRESVLQVFEESHVIYGSGKIAKNLSERGGLESACRNTVARAIRRIGLGPIRWIATSQRSVPIRSG